VRYLGPILDCERFYNVHVVAYYQLTATVISLPPARQVFRSVEPLHSEIYVRRILCTDLKNLSYPVLNGVLGVLLFRCLGDKDVRVNFELGFLDCDAALENPAEKVKISTETRNALG
jgi:hypothetical protein